MTQNKKRVVCILVTVIATLMIWSAIGIYGWARLVFSEQEKQVTDFSRFAKMKSQEAGLFLNSSCDFVVGKEEYTLKEHRCYVVFRVPERVEVVSLYNAEKWTKDAEDNSCIPHVDWEEDMRFESVASFDEHELSASLYQGEARDGYVYLYLVLVSGG